MLSTPLKRRVSRKARRVTKTVRQRLSNLGVAEQAARALFVFGSQRSGTRLPIEVMERTPYIQTYPEGHSRAFNGVLLKDLGSLMGLLRQSPFPIIAFKPICESHRALELLEDFPDSKALWIFRDYQAAVHSAAEKWGHGRNNLTALASGMWNGDDWRAGGMTPEKLELVRDHYHEDMSTHAAHALMWYLRNLLFFDLGLHQDPRVLLIKYEDLVTTPDQHFERVFRFLSCPFEARFVAGVYSTSARKKRVLEMPDTIESLCVEVSQRLEQSYADSFEHYAKRGR